jgi:hypothetical protein
VGGKGGTMAVLKSKRGQSNMQFLENAYELEVFTIKQAVKFPSGKITLTFA